MVHIKNWTKRNLPMRNASYLQFWMFILNKNKNTTLKTGQKH